MILWLGLIIKPKEKKHRQVGVNYVELIHALKHTHNLQMKNETTQT